MKQIIEKLKVQSPDGKDIKGKDPRHIVTPDAFTVSDKLLGLPLATPKRRAAAIGLDLLIIQQLSHIGSTLLGLSIIIIFILLANAKGKKTVGTFRRTLFRFLAILMFIYLVVVESMSYYETREFSLLKSDRSSVPVAELSENKQADIIEEDNPGDLSVTEQLSQAKQQIKDLEDDNAVLSTNEDSDLMDMLEALAKKFGYGFGWAGVYFTLFTFLLHGQTPGKFIFRIKVVQLDGQRLSVWSSFARYGGYAASVVTGLAGFLQIFWDPNRQGLHDKVASTVVIKV